MKRIETNYEKLYIKGEKSGSATVTLTCDNPITVNIISYTNDLTGSVSINTTGNNTNTVNINVEYADLYLNGETYSGVINASTSTDQLSIPVIINCSDTLIYTNIPNNVIEDVSNGFTIEYNSLPEVNSVKLVNKYDYQINDISNRLTINDKQSIINIERGDLLNNDYIIASNKLSQVSSFIYRESPTKYVFTRVTPSPINIDYKAQIISIQFYSKKDGETIPFNYNEVSGLSFLENKLLDENLGLWELRLGIGENFDTVNKTYNINIVQNESEYELNWSVNQLPLFNEIEFTEDDAISDDYIYDETDSLIPTNDYMLCKYYIPSQLAGTPVRIFTTDVDLDGVTQSYTVNGESVALDLIELSESADVIFDYGSTMETGYNAELKSVYHTFTAPGIYTIRIPYIFMDRTGANWSYVDGMGLFYECHSLISCCSDHLHDIMVVWNDQVPPKFSFNHMLYGCNNLLYYVHNNVLYIGGSLGKKYGCVDMLGYAFYNCRKLRRIVCDDIECRCRVQLDAYAWGVYKLVDMNYTFYNCENIDNRTANLFLKGKLFEDSDISSNYFSEGRSKYSFYNCKSLTNLYVNCSMKEYFFWGCTNLKYISHNGEVSITDTSLPRDICAEYKCDVYNADNRIIVMSDGWKYNYNDYWSIPCDDIDYGGQIVYTTIPLENGEYMIFDNNVKRLNIETDQQLRYEYDYTYLIVSRFDEEGIPIPASPVVITINTESRYLEFLPKVREYIQKIEFFKGAKLMNDAGVGACKSTSKYDNTGKQLTEVIIDYDQPYMLDASSMFIRSALQSPPVTMIRNCDMSYMYGYNKNLVDVVLDCNNCYILDSFSGCTGLKSLNIIGDNIFTTSVSPTTVTGGVEGCTALQTLSTYKDSKLVYTWDFSTNQALTNFNGVEGLTSNINLSNSNLLTHESLMSIINNASTPSSTSRNNIIIGETNLNKLTDEEKAIAINKGWTLS